ncbi:MAG: YARHG domain-containing protein [Thiohalospira sp.]
MAQAQGKLDKMKNQFIIIFSLITVCVQAQEIVNYNYHAFSFIGYKDNKPVFICNPLSKHDYSVDERPGSLYFAEAHDGFLSFVLYKEIDRKAVGDALFIQDNCIGYDSFYSGQTLTVRCNDEISKFEFNDDVFYGSYAVSSDNELVISPTDGKSAQLEYLLFDELSQSRIRIPLIGNFPVIVNDWLYFSTYHINPKYTHYPVDIYKVKIGDWNNPELLLEEAVESWIPIPNTEIIYTRISIEGNLENVYYNTSNKTYEITSDHFNPRMIRHGGKYKILNTCKDDATGNIKYCLKELPDFNNKIFTTKDNRAISDNLITVNLSNSQKPFTNTFLTKELLYNASETELSKLDKDKLRLLRNAFFARQGYQFKSDDLQEFFGQFEWYNQLLKSYKVLEITNEDVVISPKDKERVELMMKLENSK